MRGDFYNFLDGSITCGRCEKKVKGWSILFHWFCRPLTHYPMNTCCEKCLEKETSDHEGTIYTDYVCQNTHCPCHQEKPTHEIVGFEWELEALMGHLDNADYIKIKDLFFKTLTHQKESILSKLVRKEHTPDCINREDGYGHLYRDCNQNCQANGYNQGIADAIEVVQLG